MGAATAGVHSLCVFVPKDQNKMTFECVSSLENQDYCERSVHLSVSPPPPGLEAVLARASAASRPAGRIQQRR